MKEKRENMRIEGVSVMGSIPTCLIKKNRSITTIERFYFYPCALLCALIILFSKCSLIF